MKTKVRNSAIAFVAIGALLLGVAAPAGAATATWYNGNSSTNNRYYEPTSYSNAISRTGQYVNLSDSSPTGTWVKVWIGSANSAAYATQVYVDLGYRVYGASGRGSFTWQVGDLGSESTHTLAQALNALPVVQKSSSDGDSREIPAETDPSLSRLGLRPVGEYSGHTILRSEVDGIVYLGIKAADGALFVGGLDRDRFAHQALTLSIHEPHLLDEQFVLVDESRVDESGLDPALSQVAPGVYRDLAWSERTSLSSDQLTKSATDYQIYLNPLA